jgi:hypothetical protein
MPVEQVTDTRSNVIATIKRVAQTQQADFDYLLTPKPARQPGSISSPQVPGSALLAAMATKPVLIATHKHCAMASFHHNSARRSSP